MNETSITAVLAMGSANGPDDDPLGVNATLAIARSVPGLHAVGVANPLRSDPEHMRLEGAKKTKHAALSRGVCGVRDKTLILNLPGSPAGAVESLEAVLDLIPHALNLLDGKTEHS